MEHFEHLKTRRNVESTHIWFKFQGGVFCKIFLGGTVLLGLWVPYPILSPLLYSRPYSTSLYNPILDYTSFTEVQSLVP